MEEIQKLKYEIEELTEQLSNYKDTKRAIRNLGLDAEVENEIERIKLNREFNNLNDKLYYIEEAIKRMGLETHLKVLIDVIKAEEEVPF